MTIKTLFMPGTYPNRSMSMLCVITLKRMQMNLISTNYVIYINKKKHELLCGCQIDNRNSLNPQIYLINPFRFLVLRRDLYTHIQVHVYFFSTVLEARESIQGRVIREVSISGIVYIEESIDYCKFNIHVEGY